MPMRRWIPLFILILLAFAFYYFELNKYFTLETVRLYYHQLTDFVDKHPIASPLLFTFIYFIIVSLAIHDGALFSILAGILFDQPISTFCIVIGGGVGAISIFLVARGFLHDWLLKRTGPRLEKMKANMLADAAHYLLFLRLTPFLPFSLTNLAAAMFNVPLWTFAWTTFVGTLPASFVFAQAGEGLRSILELEGEVTWADVFNDQVTFALFMLMGLACLALCARFIWKSPSNEN